MMKPSSLPCPISNRSKPFVITDYSGLDPEVGSSPAGADLLTVCQYSELTTQPIQDQELLHLDSTQNFKNDYEKKPFTNLKPIFAIAFLSLLTVSCTDLQIEETDSIIAEGSTVFEELPMWTHR